MKGRKTSGLAVNLSIKAHFLRKEGREKGRKEGRREGGKEENEGEKE